jgi:LAO/AO transport system kinase
MKPMELQETIEGLKAGDRLALSKFLTDVETSDNPMEMVLRLYNRVERTTPIIGVTGFPGAGKSSLINSFIKLLRMKEKKVGVIAVDPSSLISGGSLLGDRTRMEQHSSDDKVFIRSLSSDGELGGLSHKSFLLSLVMATFNFDFIFVETVGIGQSESDITKLADFSILTLAPGLGDSILAF